QSPLPVGEGWVRALLWAQHPRPIEGHRDPIPLNRIPREGGGPDFRSSDRRLTLFWIPAFAGNTAVR
ncbi:MAG: hypothetical protein ORN25_09345, partial [Caulobacteraceae bacterium]|nr:hypothetical protein [Caulobacteraceae bacterium]